MGLAHSPKIVTDGLFSYIDPANPKSYPGSGTTAFDLTTNNKNGSMLGGLGYSSDDGGRFNFDGTNDRISFGTNTMFPLFDYTIDVWFRSTGTTPTTGTSPGIFGGTYGLRLFVTNAYINYRVDQQNLSSILSTNTPSTFSFYNGEWNFLTCQASSSNSLMKLYINGIPQIEESVAWTGYTRWSTSNPFNFGLDNNTSSYYFKGSMASIKIYNTFLTESEVKQNFNAHRGRFGI